MYTQAVRFFRLRPPRSALRCLIFTMSLRCVVFIRLGIDRYLRVKRHRRVSYLVVGFLASIVKDSISKSTKGSANVADPPVPFTQYLTAGAYQSV